MKPAAILAALRQPVSKRVRVRRSTVLMVVMFLGLGALWLAERTPSATGVSFSCPNGCQVQHGANGRDIVSPNPATTTTVPPTTTTRPTTTRPTTTTTRPTASTTAPATSTTVAQTTTTTVAVAHSTTTSSTSSTTAPASGG